MVVRGAKGENAHADHKPNSCRRLVHCAVSTYDQPRHALAHGFRRPAKKFKMRVPGIDVERLGAQRERIVAVHEPDRTAAEPSRER